MLVTDYGEIEALHGLHAVAADNKVGPLIYLHSKNLLAFISQGRPAAIVKLHQLGPL